MPHSPKKNKEKRKKKFYSAHKWQSVFPFSNPSNLKLLVSEKKAQEKNIAIPVSNLHEPQKVSYVLLVTSDHL